MKKLLQALLVLPVLLVMGWLGWMAYFFLMGWDIVPATGGLAANILGCFAFAWTVLLVGPLMVSAWISRLLFPPGFGGIWWLAFVLALAIAQYVLLFFAFTRLDAGEIVRGTG